MMNKYELIKRISIACILCILFFTGCNQGGDSTQITQEDTPQSAIESTPTEAILLPGVEVRPETDLTIETGRTVNLQAVASGGGSITYLWELSGVGELSDTTEKPAVIYTAPSTIEEGKNTAIVFLTVSNEAGETLESVSISIVAATTAIAELPETTPETDPEEPTPESTVETLPPTEEPTQSITLDNIEDGDTIPCMNARGTYDVEEVTEEIWPVVFINNVWYPQDATFEPALKNNGVWSQPIRLGDCDKNEHSGIEFQLFIVRAPEVCHQQFIGYFAVTKAGGDFSGIPHSEVDPSCKENISIAIFVTRE